LILFLLFDVIICHSQELRIPYRFSEESVREYFTRSRENNPFKHPTNFKIVLRAYERLSFSIKSNKNDYCLGEPVFVQLEVHVPQTLTTDSRVLAGLSRTLYYQLWLMQKMVLKNHRGEEIAMTEVGRDKTRSEYDPRETDWVRIRYTGEARNFDDQFADGVIPLNMCFDLSLSDQYLLKSIRYSMSPFQYYDPPRETNTLEFRIKSGPPFRSSGLKEPGTWLGVTEKSFERFDDLQPSGDYSKLKYVLRTNKTKYKEAEPVFLRLFLQNESEDTIHVCVGGDPCWTAQSWSLIRRWDKDKTIEDLESQAQLHIGIAKEANPDHAASLTQFFADRISRLRQIDPEVPVPKLRLGQLHFPDVPRDAAEVDWVFERPSFVKLGPGEEVEMEPGEVQLNLYYDLSSPGKYVLKCQRSTVIPSQKFDSPLESNEVEFEVVQGSHLTPGDLVDPGGFDSIEE